MLGINLYETRALTAVHWLPYYNSLVNFLSHWNRCLGYLRFAKGIRPSLAPCGTRNRKRRTARQWGPTTRLPRFRHRTPSKWYSRHSWCVQREKTSTQRKAYNCRQDLSYKLCAVALSSSTELLTRQNHPNISIKNRPGLQGSTHNLKPSQATSCRKVPRHGSLTEIKTNYWEYTFKQPWIKS